MKLLHTVKTGKVNEIPLVEIKTTTRHTQKKGKVQHEGWALTGTFKDKSHEYTLLFSPEEAKEFYLWLGTMLPRFELADLDTVIQKVEGKDT